MIRLQDHCTHLVFGDLVIVFIHQCTFPQSGSDILQQVSNRVVLPYHIASYILASGL